MIHPYNSYYSPKRGYFGLACGCDVCVAHEGQTLTSDVLKVTGLYGSAAALEGDELFIGEYLADSGGNAVGEVHYYTRPDANSDFVRQSGFHAPSPTSGMQFGFGLAYDGTTLVVGAPNSGAGGEVFVYTWNGSAWTHDQTITSGHYTTAPGNQDMRFGLDVAVSGNHMLIGAPDAFDGVTENGFVEYWELSGGSWSFVQKVDITSGVGGYNPNAGQGVCMVDDSTAFVTYNDSSDRKMVRKITRSGSSWSQDGSFNTGKLAGDASFAKMDSDGTNLVVGFEVFDNGPGGSLNGGAAFVYNQDGKQLGGVVGKTDGVRSGFGVAISGTELVVGSPFDDPSSTSNAGSATLWTICI